jgi:DNA-binding MarR family transcriptional regulator
MNVDRPAQSGTDQFKSLQILDELSNNDSLTQRDLSSRLGIALGLVNSYIKNLVAKGYITVKSIPTKRYAYYLTPKGFAEKTRLTYDLLQDYTRIYREAKNNYRKLFHELEKEGIENILFAGADEVAEFAYITLQETGIRLVGVVDNDKIGEKFFGRDIKPISTSKEIPHSMIVITSFVRRDEITKELLNSGISRKNIRIIFNT